jgi:hypothetical protein
MAVQSSTPHAPSTILRMVPLPRTLRYGAGEGSRSSHASEAQRGRWRGGRKPGVTEGAFAPGRFHASLGGDT